MASANTTSGTDGAIVITSASNAVILVTEWRLQKSPTLASRINSTSGGAEERGLVKKDSKFNVSFLWDSSKTPEDASIDQGDTATAKFKIGGSSLGYMAVPVIAGNVEITGCSQTGLVSGTAELFVQGTLPDPSAYS